MQATCETGVRYDRAAFVVRRVIKKTKVVNSDVFKCPYSAVVNYVNILCVAGLCRKSVVRCRSDVCLLGNIAEDALDTSPAANRQGSKLTINAALLPRRTFCLRKP